MKKIVSLFLILALFVCSLTTVQAYQPYQVYQSDDVFSDTMELDSPLNKADLSSMQTKDYFSYSVSNPDFRAYSLLNNNQKRLYDAIKNAPIGTMTITASYSVGELPTANLTKIFLTEVMRAVCYDLPQLFYHAGYSAGYSYTSSGYITQIRYMIKMYEGVTYTADTVASCYNKMQNVINSLTFDTSNRYRFVKSLHDYLCNNIIYPDLDSEYYVMDCHDPYGALVSGYAVCQGYAETFKMICDLYKIPCVYISGTANGGGHGWNAVQMDDGYWYLLDATWNDQESRIYYDFFLVGLNTKDTYFGGEAFSTSHVNDADLFLPQLNYAKEKYSQTNHNTAFQATYNSLAKNNSKHLICSYYDAVNNSNIYYNGISVDLEYVATNTAFTIPTNETWILVLIGDCNGDGYSDAMDYSEAVNKVLADKEVSTAYDMAADADCDGCLDVIDLALLERAISGVNDKIIIE